MDVLSEVGAGSSDEDLNQRRVLLSSLVGRPELNLSPGGTNP